MALTSTEEVASLRGSSPGDTRHDPLAQQPEVLAIRLGFGFEIGERAKILRAVSDYQQGIDKGTVMALAASRKLPVSSFNWCGS